MKYKELVQVYEALFSTTKRLDKTVIISEFLKVIPSTELENVIYLLQGHIYANWEKKNIGIASSLMIKAIANMSSHNENEIELLWKKDGDLGIVAEKVAKNKKQTTLFSKTDFTVDEIIFELRRLVEVSGKGAVDYKIKILTKLLSNSSPLEAKYLTRTVLEDLRIGLGEGSLKDALVWAYLPKPIPLFKECNSYLIPSKIDCDEMTKLLSFLDNYHTQKIVKINDTKLEPIDDTKSNILDKLTKIDFSQNDRIICENEKTARIVLDFFSDEVQKAIDASNDFYKVAYSLKEKGLSGLYDIEVTEGTPIKVMLAQKVNNVEEGFNSVGKPAAFEYKLDGFRMQIHKTKDYIKLYTRRLEEVTNQFPDVVEIIKENINGDTFILDSEIVGIDPITKKPRPFQEISQRIKRKYDISEIKEKLPVEVFLFDVILYNGKSYLHEDYLIRRKLLEKIVNSQENKIEVTPQIVTEFNEAAQEFYDKALNEGHEGVMIKMIDAPYKPGSRVGSMVKLKPIMESLDLVIVEAEYGTGKRAGWFSSFTLACYDSKENKFKDIGKIGTGFKEKSEDGLSFEELTKILKKYVIEESGRSVKIKPQIVIEVDYQEIQESPTYSSGFALRFPRLKRIRDDKGAKQASELSYIKNLFYHQFSKNK